MTEGHDNRRRAERVRLAMPRPARLSGANVVLSDVSIVGAGIQHHVQIPKNSILQLAFRWEKQELEINCRLARSRLELYSQGETTLRIYHSGLVFLEGEEEGNDLRGVIEKRVVRALEAQKADAYAVEAALKSVTDSSGAINLNLFFPLFAESQRDFIRCTYEHGRWKRETVPSPEQPENGFTVSAQESPDEIDLLCKTFLAADYEERRLIRIFAHLSVAEPSPEPRDKYLPK